MEVSSIAASDFDDLSTDELKALVVSQRAELASTKIELQSSQLMIEQLKLQILKLRRMQFGQSSEKRAQQIEQLELLVEKLETTEAENLARVEQRQATSPIIKRRQMHSEASVEQGQRRREFPAHLPRETQVIEPTEHACPDCGKDFSKLGEDVSEMLELEPLRFKVIRFVRPKLACTGCDTIVQAPAPSRPIDRCIPGPGLLAHVIVGKYSDHLPLYRQSEIYAREGVDLDRTLLAEWVGRANVVLTPLVNAVREHVLAADVVSADDTPIPVLSPGLGKTKTGRLWTYVRDERPAGGTIAPAVWFAYSSNRRGENPQTHLENFTGILQADGYAGYTKLYEGGQVVAAACRVDGDVTIPVPHRPGRAAFPHPVPCT